MLQSQLLMLYFAKGVGNLWEKICIANDKINLFYEGVIETRFNNLLTEVQK
jgi:hypothetical protein